MTLNTPLIYAINAFDPSYSHTFEFSYSGNQAVANRAVIVDNETQTEVYNVKQEGLKLNHILAADTLEVGHSYLIQIQVYDANDNYSNLSDAVLFYCFTTPQFYFSNVNDGDTISAANFDLALTYAQSETETLNEYKYYVYDMTNELIYTSESFYTETDMTHTIYGLKNNYIYYVRAIGKTTHGMTVDTGMIQITVSYYNISSSVAFEAVNDSQTGCIILKTNITSVGYDLLNDNYTIENGMVDLTGNTLTYKAGTSGDFPLIIKAKHLPIGKFCWSTDGSITVSIECICDLYYAHLSVRDNDIKYDVFRQIIGGYLVNSTGNTITDSEHNYLMIVKEGYDNETLMALQIYRKNNRYDIDVSYV